MAREESGLSTRPRAKTRDEAEQVAVVAAKPGTECL
jgi:hypothetical protein